MTIPLTVFDLETTGPNPHEARIVTAYLGLLDANGDVIVEQNWLVNPGVEIPQGAIDVHGVTNEQAATGVAPIKALGQIVTIIEIECRKNGHPLAGQNLAYDLTVLDREIRRHVGEPQGWSIEGITVLDSYVIDKQIDKYRKGSRKLVDMARHYGVPITEEEAHAASFDAIAAGRIVQRQLAGPKLRFNGGPAGLAFLRQAMPVWAAEQAEGYAEWRRSPKAGPQQDVNFRAEQGWPVRVAA